MLTLKIITKELNNVEGGIMKMLAEEILSQLNYPTRDFHISGSRREWKTATA